MRKFGLLSEHVRNRPNDVFQDELVKREEDLAGARAQLQDAAAKHQSLLTVLGEREQSLHTMEQTLRKRPNLLLTHFNPCLTGLTRHYTHFECVLDQHSKHPQTRYRSIPTLSNHHQI